MQVIGGMQMIKNILDKLREKFNDYKKLNNKKMIEYLILIAVMGIATIIAANSLWGGERKSDKKIVNTPKLDIRQDANEPNYGLEQKIAQILSEIKGVGRVSVLVTYTSGPESVLARDINQNQTDTNEKDSGGGERRVLQKEEDDKMVFTEEQSGLKKPIVLKQLTSKVMGVVVVADGADDVATRANIVRAIEAVAGVPGYRIQVFKKQ